MDDDASGDGPATEPPRPTTSVWHTLATARTGTPTPFETTTSTQATPPAPPAPPAPTAPTAPPEAQVEAWGMLVVFVLVCFFTILLGRWCVSQRCKGPPRKLPQTGTVLANMAYAAHPVDPGRAMREQLLADNDGDDEGDGGSDVVYTRKPQGP